MSTSTMGISSRLRRCRTLFSAIITRKVRVVSSKRGMRVPNPSRTTKTARNFTVMRIAAAAVAAAA
jgi:hypothetical protein